MNSRKLIVEPAPTDNNYWSSSIYASNPNNSWNVNFNDGSTNNNDRTNTNYVRCVRALPPPAPGLPDAIIAITNVTYIHLRKTI